MDLSAKERSLAYCATGAPRRYEAIVSNRACAKPFRRGSLKNHHEHTNTSAPDARRAEAFLLLRCHVGSRRGVLRHTIFKWGFGSRLASTRRELGDVEDFTSTRRGMWAIRAIQRLLPIIRPPDPICPRHLTTKIPAVREFNVGRCNGGFGISFPYGKSGISDDARLLERRTAASIVPRHL